MVSSEFIVCTTCDVASWRRIWVSGHVPVIIFLVMRPQKASFRTCSPQLCIILAKVKEGPDLRDTSVTMHNVFYCAVSLSYLRWVEVTYLFAGKINKGVE